jgi:glycosyltransferase involved in cell wall biosynthesis
MNVAITCENHFIRTPDGRVWTDGILPYPSWARYLSVFDSVRVVARMRDVTVRSPKHQLASGAGVAFWGVPDFRGPEQYLLRATSIAAATAKAVQAGDAVILRVPGRIGTCVEQHVLKMRRPYAVEVVNDLYDVFAPKGVRHPLRPFFRWWFTRNLRRQCARSCAAAYVTEYALQRRYPPGPETFATSCSDVELPPAAFVNAPRTSMPDGYARLIFVGSLAQLYKAPDVLLDAVGECARCGLNIGLVLLGSGRYQLELESRARALGLDSRVQFRGQLARPEAVRHELDQADFFVLPSRAEGLPRSHDRGHGPRAALYRFSRRRYAGTITPKRLGASKRRASALKED